MKMRVNIAKIKPLGAVLIAVLGILGIIVCFTADLGVPAQYQSQHDTAYYSQNADTLAELLDEAREHVFPNLSGIVSAEVTGGVVSVHVEARELDKARAVLQRDFGEGLFEFFKAG